MARYSLQPAEGETVYDVAKLYALGQIAGEHCYIISFMYPDGDAAEEVFSRAEREMTDCTAFRAKSFSGEEQTGWSVFGVFTRDNLDGFDWGDGVPFLLEPDQAAWVVNRRIEYGMKVLAGEAGEHNRFRHDPGTLI